MSTPTPPARHRLRLHGDACLRRADGSSVPLGGRSAALLALVALEPGIRRERAAQLLWPEATNPRQNLRQQLLRLRAALELAAIDGDDALQLAADIALEPAAAGAELLAGELAGDDPFGLWLAQQRARALRSQREPLRAALQAAEQEGDLARALELAEALVEIEPDAEPHHQALMRLHYLRGENAAGLAAYKRLADRMRVQFGSAPSRASDELAEALRRGAVVAPPSPAAPLASAASAAPRAGGTAAPAAPAAPRPTLLPMLLKRPPRLVGRSAELAAARAAWAEGRVVLLEGEAGLGKSRLIGELVAACLDEPEPSPRDAPGRPTLLGSGRPGDAGAPYATLARWIAPLMEAPLPAEALTAPVRDALAHLGSAAAARPRSEFRPDALQRAVQQLLHHHGVRTVVLDDLHFADDATLDLVAGLTADTPVTPVTPVTPATPATPAAPAPTPPAPQRWLLAQRPAEAPAAARALRSALTELRRLDVVPLRPLDAEATAELVAALAIDGLDAGTLAPALARHSGGNPLFLLETLKLGLHDGSLLRGELPRPASVGALIEHRLARVSEPALALARVAAIAGVDFGIEFAEAAIGQSAVQLASAWDELQQAQVLREEAFAHDLVADAVLRGVPAVVARRVHAQCAAWLEQRGGEPARVARHWQEGGDALRAARAWVAAAERAADASRNLEEAEHYGRAADCFDVALLPHEAFDARLGRLGALTAAVDAEGVLEDGQRLLDGAVDDLQRVQATRVLVDLLGHRGQHDRALALALPALELARRIESHHEQLLLLTPIVGCLGMLNRGHEALDLLLPLKPWVRQHAAPLDRAGFHGKLAAALAERGRLREAVQESRQALEIERAQGIESLQCTTLQHLSVYENMMGRAVEAEAASAESVRLHALEMKGALFHALLRFTNARHRFDLGQYGSALAVLLDVDAQLRKSAVDFWPEAVELQLAHTWLRLGQTARALPSLLRDDDASPPRLRATRRQLRIELAQMFAAAAPSLPALADIAADARRRVPGLEGSGITVWISTLRGLPDEAVVDEAPALAHQALQRERFGLTLTALAWHATAASRLERQEAARASLVQALALVDEGTWPETMPRNELLWLLFSAARRIGAEDMAARALADGLAWLQQRAVPDIPAEFLDGFLHRHPVNRQLLAAAPRPAET
jgi:DNA-binding SARP family transcriptional activator